MLSFPLFPELETSYSRWIINWRGCDSSLFFVYWSSCEHVICVRKGERQRKERKERQEDHGKSEKECLSFSLFRELLSSHLPSPLLPSSPFLSVSLSPLCSQAASPFSLPPYFTALTNEKIDEAERLKREERFSSQTRIEATEKATEKGIGKGRDGMKREKM